MGSKWANNWVRFQLGSFWEADLEFPDTPLCSPRLDVPPGFGTYILTNGIYGHAPGTRTVMQIRLIPLPNPDSGIIWELIPMNIDPGEHFPYGIHVEPP